MYSCHTVMEDNKVLQKKNKILLMGNPNVGKSVFFTELTGINAISSNYAGTTVTYMDGAVTIGKIEYTLIDVPGTYSMTSTSEAEAVAVSFMESNPVAVVCVLDATNLERNLCLAIELQQYNIPIIYALNLMDVAKRHGVEINVKLLEQELNAPVVATIAVKKEGIYKLVETLGEKLQKKDDLGGQCDECPHCQNANELEDPWQRAKNITRRVRKIDVSNPNFLDRLGDSMMEPFPGVPLAILVMILCIGVIVGGGKALRATILLPIVNQVLVPFFNMLFTSFLPEGMLMNILIGEYGIFVISFEWIIALILPYVFLFYVVFSFLEDSGYLPRVSVLFDNIMRNLGIQGGSMITIAMGYGCAVPAIVGSRTATTKKERLIISTAVCFAVPCISQTGALISLLGGYAWWLMLLLILFSLGILMIVVAVSGKLIKGSVDPLLIEIPNLLMPERKAYGKKLMIRMKHFMFEAELPMMISIVIASLLKETGLLDYIAVYAEPLVSNWLGMPKEAVIALILGIVRREMAAAPLLALNLSPLQAFIGATVALLYLPCLSVFGILTKEFKTKVALIIFVSTTLLALFVGGLINQIAHLFM